MKACKLKITGDVQGVFYRHNAKKEGMSLGLSGWVKNEHDGSVSLFIQGEDEKVDEMIAWAREGSPMAMVSDVEEKKADYDTNLKGFEVR